MSDPFTPYPPMPVRAGRPQSSPLYVRDTQGWAVQQERQRHDQAIYSVGEYAIFFLLWNLLDFERGLVGRCSLCSGATSDAKHQAAAAVYSQPLVNKCPRCFGTTFEGGLRARIVRPSVFGDADEQNQLDRKGQVNPEEVLVESTSDFRVRQGDVVVRYDNRRYQLRTPRRVMLRTGFGSPEQSDAAINYSLTRASLQAPSTVSYQIPPADPAVIKDVLKAKRFSPGDWSDWEQINGPLIPEDD